MSDTFVSAYDWDVQQYSDPLHSSYPSQIIGTFPLDPGDDTYAQARVSNFGTSSLPTQGVVYGFWNPVDVTSNPSPRVRVRMSGFMDGSGYQTYPQVDLFPLGSQYTPAAQIGSSIFPYPTDWRTPGVAGSYTNDEIQQAEFGLSPAAQAALRDTGLAIRVTTQGSATTGLDYELIMRVREMRVALAGPTAPAPLRIHPRSSTRIYPRRNTRRPGTF